MLKMLSLFFVFNTSSFIQQKELNIDEIYIELAKGRHISYKKVDGEFIYPENNENKGSYTAEFFGKEKRYSIVYNGYSSDRKDNIKFNNQLFTLNDKIDPFSLVIYKFGLNNKYLCLIGKGQSASGSGMQVSYFIVFELDKLGIIKKCYKFSSRFGNINSLVDYNSNGSINYFKIVNGGKMGQYVLTVNDVKSDKRINKRLVLLNYKLNNKFVVLKDTLQ